ncbi:hypothetical protein FACS189476_07990 [Spirochaetia bacterium]|nr:hypothetical protein FACS189476_07990 [Spirochaetia bacterium]
MKKNRKGNGAFGTKAMLMVGMLAAVLAFGLVLAGCDPGGDDDRSAADILGAMVDKLSTATTADWDAWYAGKSFTAKEKQNLYNYFSDHQDEANVDTQLFWMALFAEWGLSGEGGEGTDPTPPGGGALDDTSYQADGAATQLIFGDSGPGTFTFQSISLGVWIEGTYTRSSNTLTFTATDLHGANAGTYTSFTGTLSSNDATLTLSFGTVLTRQSGGH